MRLNYERMKNRVPQGTQKIGACAGSGIRREAESENPADSATQQRVVLELAEVKRALTKSRRALKSACQQIETLTNANSKLKSNFMHLARKEAQTRTFAYHDELTGLPNRRLLQDRLSQAVAQGARHHTQVVLLLLDLDDFKSINDRLGHAAGDKVLRVAAERLAGDIRGADTACRYGGDEFVVMLPELEDARMAATVAKKLQGSLRAPYLIDGFEIRMTASAGSVVYPDEGESYAELMDKADVALYSAKTTSGKVSITTLAKYSTGEDSRGLTQLCRSGAVTT